MPSRYSPSIFFQNDGLKKIKPHDASTSASYGFNNLGEIRIPKYKRFLDIVQRLFIHSIMTILSLVGIAPQHRNLKSRLLNSIPFNNSVLREQSLSHHIQDQ